MNRILTVCFIIVFCLGSSVFAQTKEQQEKLIKKYEIRPSSRDYAPVRRGNDYQAIERSKTPTLKSQQIASKNKNIGKADQKSIKHTRISASSRNRRIKR
jgi:hypothetical protein